jgi:small GTP-binding protein
LFWQCNSKKKWNHGRLLILGDENSGKSCLLKALQGKSFNPQRTATDGVDIQSIQLSNWRKVEPHTLISFSKDLKTAVQKTKDQKIQYSSPIEQSSSSSIEPISDYLVSKSKEVLNQKSGFLETIGEFLKPKRHSDSLTTDRDLILNCWDFGGQEIYYNTHHFFFTQEGIFLVVIDFSISLDTNKERLEFWLNSIRNQAPNSISSPIVLALTKVDKVDTKIIETKLKTILEILSNFEISSVVLTSAKSRRGINELKEILSSLASGLPSLERSHPLSWIAFI